MQTYPVQRLFRFGIYAHFDAIMQLIHVLGMHNVSFRRSAKMAKRLRAAADWRHEFVDLTRPGGDHEMQLHTGPGGYPNRDSVGRFLIGAGFTQAEVRAVFDSATGNTERSELYS